jgi:phosphoesterase RecJ-like protein
LLEAGVQPYEVSQRLFDAWTRPMLRLLSEALGAVEVFGEGELGMAALDRGMFSRSGATDEDASPIINFVRGLEGVEAAAVLREGADGRHRLSLRSRGKLDMAAVARGFGGGGHAAAAGATLECPFAEACDRVRAALLAVRPGKA